MTVWTRYFPAVEKIREIIENGTIGTPKLVTGDFCFRDPGIPRITQPELGGGALLDIGCYLIAFSSMIFGGRKPNTIKAVGHLTSESIDLNSSIILTYGQNNEQAASLHCSVEVEGNKSVTIFGDKGRIVVHKPFWCPTTLSVYSNQHPDVADIHEFPLVLLFGSCC